MVSVCMSVVVVVVAVVVAGVSVVRVAGPCR